mmetsp:Transcript_124770/g.216364  ORF Transcript_124770/g.216364 Transcript_124770/m.216364 type:complete len:590 (-) Transcript_124770:58-1827(-)
MRAFTLPDIIAILLATAVAANIPNARFLFGPTARGYGPAARGLQEDSESTSPRGPCSMPLIRMAEPKTMSDYNDCIGAAVDKADFTVAGANFETLHTCWCKHGMQELMNEFQCCQYDDFKLLCEADCSPDCSKPKATECVEDCPAICLEGDYAPQDVCTNCLECFDYMRCITNHSKERTSAGDPDHPRVCDNRAFDSSDEMKDWQDCFTDHPMRTHWHRTNAEHHCICKEDLKKVAETHNCCGAKWAGKICTDVCDSMTSTCDSAEAKQCMDDCGQKCAALHPANMVEECKTHCVDEGSKCEKYKICQPTGPFEHGYICDDGSAPPANGCCARHPRSGLPVCPSMCDSGTSHMLQHGIECQCKGCPESVDEAKTKFNVTLSNNLRENGWQTLTDIVRRAKLDHANKKMQKMITSRNEEILAAWQAHPGAIDDAFQKKVKEINEKWLGLIEEEAKREKTFGPEPEPTPAPPVAVPAPGPSPETKEGGAPVIIIIIASVGGLILIFGILVMIYKIKSTSAKNANPGAGVAGGVQPNDGDPNVVVGRPVEGGGEAASAAAATGAPVQTGGKGSDEPTKGEPSKGDNAPPQFA